jgi:hypothetical protein
MREGKKGLTLRTTLQYTKTWRKKAAIYETHTSIKHKNVTAILVINLA